MSKKDSLYPSFSKVVALVLVIMAVNGILKLAGGFGKNNSAEKAVNDYAIANGFSLSDYPDEIIRMFEMDEETKDFVLNYPKKIVGGNDEEIDLSEYAECTEPPLLMQWDSRWGYREYNNSVVGLSGSAPTCLSMAALYELHDMSMNPLYMVNLAMENDWESKPEKLLSDGARMIGMSATEIPINDSRLRQAVNSDMTVVCLTDGKYLSTVFVIRGINENGNYMINDPMSRKNSEREYTFADIQNHLKKMWGYNGASEQ